MKPLTEHELKLQEQLLSFLPKTRRDVFIAGFQAYQSKERWGKSADELFEEWVMLNDQ